jgi:hypothetical protein
MGSVVQRKHATAHCSVKCCVVVLYDARLFMWNVMHFSAVLRVSLAVSAWTGQFEFAIQTDNLPSITTASLTRKFKLCKLFLLFPCYERFLKHPQNALLLHPPTAHKERISKAAKNK